MKLQVVNEVSALPVVSLVPAGYSAGSSALSKLEAARIAGEAHRRARLSIQNIIQPGMTLREIGEHIENCTRTLIGVGYNGGIGFPTGLSLNACAAHDTPNPKTADRVLQENDVLKIDIGTHLDGHIVDSAFTVAFKPEYANLLLAARDSVYECLKIAGPDTPLKDIGEKAEEVIRSYEVVIDGKTCGVRPVLNLNGHTIEQYKIHGGKYVPITKRSGNRDRMVEGEFYAIETFATTGNGYVREQGDCSHYALVNKNARSSLEGGRSLLEYLNRTFSTLPFCKRYIGPEVKSPDAYLAHLVKQGAVEQYPPLFDVPGSYVAQFEHTLYINSSGIEVMSKGEDY